MNVSQGDGITGKEYAHGEPGGPGGKPIPRRTHNAPVHFVDRQPLFNDPDANPYTDPYTGNPNAPLPPGYYYYGEY